MKTKLCTMVVFSVVVFAACSEDDKDKIDKKDLIPHFGCVEKSGRDCLQVGDEAKCNANSQCQFGNGQCLPAGSGCREIKTMAECDDVSYCSFKGWKMGCTLKCSTHKDKNSCNEDEVCSWDGGKGVCVSEKDVECSKNTDQEDCSSSQSGCMYYDYCVDKAYCFLYGNEPGCNKAKDCKWDDGYCKFRCTLDHTSDTECNNDPACKWEDKAYLCTPNIDKESGCYELQGDACEQNDSCRRDNGCMSKEFCFGLGLEACEENLNCSMGLCENACTTSRSKSSCEFDENCMWISVLFVPGQSCTTACHGGS